MEDLLNGYFLQVLTFVCINIILAMTIYMTLCTGILSLGNAGLMSFGAYTSAILTAQYQVPMPVGIFLGGVIAVLVALVIGLPTIRLRGLYLAIATLGFGEVVRVIALNLEITHGALGYSGIPSMGSVLSDYASDWGLLDAFEIDSQTGGQFLVCLVLLVLTVLIISFWYRLEHSRIGRAMAAVKADEYAASLSGINVVYYKMMGFLFSAFLQGWRVLCMLMSHFHQPDGFLMASCSGYASLYGFRRQQCHVGSCPRCGSAYYRSRIAPFPGGIQGYHLRRDACGTHGFPSGRYSFL